jgi:hypothetical protein
LTVLARPAALHARRRGSAAALKEEPMTAIDWPNDAVSPWRLIPWRQACSDFNIDTNTMLRLLASHQIPVVKLSTRKRCILATDLLKLAKAQQKPSSEYAVNTKVAAHG